MLRGVILLLMVTLLGACGDAEKPDARRPDPVSVYAAMSEAAHWEALFREYTEESGVFVTVKTGEADLIVKAVIANNGSPPADVLLTADVGRIWLAAEEGALRAMQSQEIESLLDSRLRDPDDLWAAAGFRAAAIVYDAAAVDLAGIGDYANLSDADLRGKLCLSASDLPVNRALIAMLISDIGQRPAEIVVRGWKRNLAQLVFETETKLLDAIADGRCAAGIASGSAVDAFNAGRDSVPLSVAYPAVAHINIDAVGVARHARNPEGAQRLVEWLVRRTAPDGAQLAGVSTNNVGIAGWRDEDAIKLAERAAYP